MFFFDYWTVFSTLIQFIHELAPRSLWVRSFGMIRIRISDTRSLGSWYIKWTEESLPRVDSLVHLIYPSDLRSLILIRIIPKEPTLWFLSFLPRCERPLLAGMLLGTFWKSQKLILSEKNQCVLVLKISFCKTEKKSPIRKNKLPQKFRGTRYTHLAWFGSTINNIGVINHLFIVSVQTV